MASWKIVIDPDPADEIKVAYTSFANARKHFKVHTSSSTAGSIFTSQQEFAEGIHRASVQKDKNTIARWGSDCTFPKNWKQFTWAPDQGKATPGCILRNESSVAAILESDIWFLLTDGEVPGPEVPEMTALGQTMEVDSCAAVFLTVSKKRYRPDLQNVSVGITSYAHCPDALCLYKDYQSGQIYVIASKGCFAALDQAKDHDMWENITSFPNETALIKRIGELKIEVPTAETRISKLAHPNLGEEWNKAHDPVKLTLVDIDNLLQAGTVSDKDRDLLLADKALEALILACRYRGKLPELRSFLIAQRIVQSTVEIQDRDSATLLIAQLNSAKEISYYSSSILLSLLQDSHVKSRKYYIATHTDVQLNVIRDRIRVVDRALSVLSDAEKSGFTAKFISRRSNTAYREENSSAESAVDVPVLDFDAPAYRGDCETCFGKNQILSLALKVLDASAMAAIKDNLTDLPPEWTGKSAKNMNVLSTQCICFQCALFARSKYSIDEEKISAVIPTLEYSGRNKLYIDYQLFKAFNQGLSTGVPAMGQAFATILDRTLRWKPPKELENRDDHGISKTGAARELRDNAVSWLLDSILTNLRVREKFNRLGEWTTYPGALTWAAEDFQREGFASWCINYPMSNFIEFLRFGKRMKVFSDEIIRDMKGTKLIHLFVSSFLARLRRNGSPRNWMRFVLQLIYVEFNSDLIPKYRGTASIVNTPSSFWRRLVLCTPATQNIVANANQEEVAHIMPRIQTLAFWLVHHQFVYISTKKYFLQIRSKEPYAVRLLDLKAAVPEGWVRHLLSSIFIDLGTVVKDRKMYISHRFIPFASPYGPSVIGCGAPDCNVSFLPEEITLKMIADGHVESTKQLLDEVRSRRSNHLIAVFGVQREWQETERIQTGLPGARKSSERPNECHTCLHAGIVKTWAKLPLNGRRALAALVVKRKRGQSIENNFHAFITETREYIARNGRGNVFFASIEYYIQWALGSFLKMLKLALVVQNRSTTTEDEWLMFAHNDEGLTLESRMRWEVDMIKRKGDVFNDWIL
ncbi:hypothetical protein NHQ30_000048 [Ciborinia camelliae]|nr:hypothetical protein NHQ30_000048 [Ciborinia camelliae]